MKVCSLIAGIGVFLDITFSINPPIVSENCMYHCSGRGEDEEKVKIEHHIDEIGESINKHKA